MPMSWEQHEACRQAGILMRWEAACTRVRAAMGYWAPSVALARPAWRDSHVTPVYTLCTLLQSPLAAPTPPTAPRSHSRSRPHAAPGAPITPHHAHSLHPHITLLSPTHASGMPPLHPGQGVVVFLALHAPPPQAPRVLLHLLRLLLQPALPPV